MRTRFILFFIVVLTIAVIYSCKKKDPKLGMINIRLTDAPGDLSAVYLDIKKVMVHSNESHPQADWVELETNSGVYDVLKLNNGQDALIASGNFPAGPFHSIRVDLGPNNSVLVDGVSYPLEMPGGLQSGIQVEMLDYLDEEEECTVLLDIDLQRSISFDGVKYVFKPAVNAVNIEQSGSIKGKITPAWTYPVVFAISGNDSTSAYPNGDGDFLIRGLKPGSYKVVARPRPPFVDAIVPNAEVQAKQVKDVGVIEMTQ